MEKPNSILVVLMGALGDVARGLAIIAPLKRHFPEVSITWLVESKCAELVRLHRGIDRVVEFKRAGGLSAAIAALRELRAARYDVCIDLQRHAKSGIVSRLSAAPLRLGFHRRDAKEFNWLFNNRFVPYRGDDGAKLSHYLSFLSLLDVPIPSDIDFGLREYANDSESASRFAHIRKPYVMFVLGSSWRSKNWPDSGYEQLRTLVLDRTGHAVVLVGDRSQKDLASRLCSTSAAGRVVDTIGTTSLKDLLYLSAHASVAVGPDSGPGHLASAMGNRYVSLFGPTSPARVAFYGNEKRSLQAAIGCAGCYRRVCPGLDSLCMRLLHPEVVFQALEIS